MNTHNVLRLLHIVGGILWVGFAVFVAAFLIPTLKALGPAGGPVMREIAGRRKLPLYMMAISWITILSGVVLMWRDASPVGTSWFTYGMGLSLTVGAAFAIVASFIGMAVSAPTASRIRTMGARMHADGRTPAPEEIAALQGLQDRLNGASTIVAMLLMVAAIAMAVARYI